MKTLLLNRIKKWLLFALIGCVAYFVGYYVGQRALKPTPSTEEGSLNDPATQTEK